MQLVLAHIMFGRTQIKIKSKRKKTHTHAQKGGQIVENERDK